MASVTTHFEQIPVEVVKKIAAQTPEPARAGVGVEPAQPGSGTTAGSREETAAESNSRLKDPTVRGVR